VSTTCNSPQLGSGNRDLDISYSIVGNDAVTFFYYWLLLLSINYKTRLIIHKNLISNIILLFMLCSHVNAEEMKKDVESEASMEPIGNSQIDAEDGDKENVSVCIYLYGSVHT